MSLRRWLNTNKRPAEVSEEGVTSAPRTKILKRTEVNAPINTELSTALSDVVNNDPSSTQPVTVSSNILTNDDIPDCWNLSQSLKFIRNNPWLIVKNKKLGCKVCQNMKRLGLHAAQGSRISMAWQACEITFGGKNKVVHQSSLRKKIFEHKASDAHKKSVENEESKKIKAIESNIQNLHKSGEETTLRVFRTVYALAKKNRPFTDLPYIVDLQKLNDVKMGRVLHSDKSGADIISHIAEEMRKMLVTDLIINKRKIAILIDECTSLSKKTTLVVCIRTHANIKLDSEAQTFYLDLIELNGTTSDIITKSLLQCLASHGFTEIFLKECLVSFACDGASVMLGKNTGVARKFQNLFPNLLVWHCSNHRLELAVSDVIKEVHGINYFRHFFDKLYALYHQSPKNQRELEEASKEVHGELLRIGRVLSVRWVASSKRAVIAVWRSFPSLHAHFKCASEDTDRSAVDRSKYSGLDRIVTSIAFVQNLGAMLDAMTELADLSEVLQRRQITLPQAQRAVSTTICVMESMASSPGPKLKEATIATESMKFKGVQLNEYGRVIKINAQQMFRSLANNLRSRLVKRESDGKSSVAIMECINIFDSNMWPPYESRDIQFGDSEIRKLCSHFSVDEAAAVRGFREYISDESGEPSKTPTDLWELRQAVHTIAVSTSECERCFSGMNRIITSVRSSLNISTVAKLLFIYCVGPPLHNVDMIKYVRSWLLKGRRSADETACKKREQKSQPHNYQDLWKLM